MKSWKEKTWQHEITGADGDVILFGVRIFDYEWKRTGRSVKVWDPFERQDYRFPVYRVTVKEQEHEFAAGELCNCVWGFYILKY